jgi:hypothetical protein
MEYAPWLLDDEATLTEFMVLSLNCLFVLINGD